MAFKKSTKVAWTPGIILSADPLFYYQPIVWVAGGALVLFSGVWISSRVYRTTTDSL